MTRVVARLGRLHFLCNEIHRVNKVTQKFLTENDKIRGGPCWDYCFDSLHNNEENVSLLLRNHLKISS